MLKLKTDIIVATVTRFEPYVVHIFSANMQWVDGDLSRISFTRVLVMFKPQTIPHVKQEANRISCIPTFSNLNSNCPSTGFIV